MRPLRDLFPRELIRQMAHTTRRYTGRSALAIAPDASRVAHVTDRSGVYCAWTAPARGGDPSLALAVEGAAVHSLCWTSRGDLLGAADRGGTERFQIYATRSDERLEPLVSSQGDAVQHLMSWNAASPDGRVLALSSNARERADMDIVLVDLASGAQRTLVSGAAWHVAGGWSPDGRTLLVMRVADNTEQTVLAVDARTGEQHEITPHGAEAQNVPVGWSADGSALVLADDLGGSRHVGLAAVDPGTLERRPIDVPEWDVELAASSQDGHVVAWSVNEDGYSRLRWTRDGRALGELELGGVCDDLVVSADGLLISYLRRGAREPGQVWVLSTRTGGTWPVVTTTIAADPSELAEPELIRIPAQDGPIPTFVFRPPQARGRVPAVLYAHGGPEAQSRPGYSHILAVLQCLVTRGIAVVVPNIHGSTGYGRAWQEAIHRDWGGIDLRDLRAVADWMGEQPDLDPERLAVFGGSYGGFATLTCVTRIPDRWRCAVDVFGVSNLVTMIENAQPNWRRFLARWIGDAERDRAKLLERSPITHIENVRCPLLIVQGANDTRVPKEESDQVVERLRALGRRVEYVVFDDEGHGFTKRANADRAYGLVVDFLTKELLER